MGLLVIMIKQRAIGPLEQKGQWCTEYRYKVVIKIVVSKEINVKYMVFR